MSPLPRCTSDDGLPALMDWLAIRSGGWRWCGACQTKHPRSAFTLNQASPDGLDVTCRAKNRVRRAETAARHKAGRGYRGKS